MKKYDESTVSAIISGFIIAIGVIPVVWFSIPIAVITIIAINLHRYKMQKENENSIELQLKSERMKTELITNVSHDIRTPLTSIINYSDLLLKQGLSHPEAPNYINVLHKKACRLSTLVDDLFEASKIMSGNIVAELTQIDLSLFVTQAIAEMTGQIEASELDFRLNLVENAFVNADGKLLWRCIQNLITNVCKYSVPNTRVYIDVDFTYNYVNLTIKNISNHELNINSDELLERFVRGDVSRTSEGSGLGLSIVQNLIGTQQGIFKIEIDGDLFKSKISLKKGG
ncbi:MAG: sensor histidine kinase [Defluviitaleaceae bacterium]|nr:sensor histidine kinase [Defluviitaleaceae bacterium]